MREEDNSLILFNAQAVLSLSFKQKVVTVSTIILIQMLRQSDCHSGSKTSALPTVNFNHLLCSEDPSRRHPEIALSRFPHALCHQSLKCSRICNLPRPVK